MSELIVTIDIDWACEYAVEFTLEHLYNLDIIPTIFTTHDSRAVSQHMQIGEVGLHPFFSAYSSHGGTIEEVVRHVIDLPYNINAFRCHRFGVCNVSKQMLLEAGMMVSSNVCTNLELIKPFYDRCGLLEIPIFLEDGGYLWNQHSMEIDDNFISLLNSPQQKIIIIHPMHFVLNTPDFGFMTSIKNNLTRNEWGKLSENKIKSLQWKQRGIRDFLLDMFMIKPDVVTLMDCYYLHATNNA